MDIYRGCVFSVFGGVIGLFSILLSRTWGVLGLLLPWILIGFVYMFVQSLIVELIYWDEDRNRGN